MNEAPTLINGPINVVRMKGIVENVEKIIYIFMDIHIDVGHQTQCDEFESIDVARYFAQNIKKAGKPLDILYEMQKWEFEYSSVYRERYIDEIQKIFKKEYHFKKNKAQPSKSNKLVRLHYMDIRNGYFSDINKTSDEIELIIDKIACKRQIDHGQLHMLIASLKKLHELIGKFDKQLFTSKSTNNDSSRDIEKIKTHYKHKGVKNNMRHMFDYIKHANISSKKLIRDILDKLENVDNFIYDANELVLISKPKKMYRYGYNNDIDDLIQYLVSHYKKIWYEFFYAFVIFTDIYLLRRFLDKDYIKTAITYTGSAHSINYIFHLSKYYNFKVTHASYSTEKNMAKLNKIIHDTKNLNEVYKIEKLLYPPIFKQCSDLKDFPNNFE